MPPNKSLQQTAGSLSRRLQRQSARQPLAAADFKRYVAKAGWLVVAMFSTSCFGQTFPALYCTTVAAHGSQDSQLFVDLFDGYADSSGLQSDKSSPSSTIYFNTANTVHVATTSLGPYGFVVTLYSREDELPGASIQDLETFVSKVVQSHFTVQRCSEIEDFETPVQYGWPKRDVAT